MERVSVAEASKLLGISPQGIRVQMQRGELPIGKAVRSVTGNGWRYLIFKDKLNEFIGRKDKETGNGTGN